MRQKIAVSWAVGCVLARTLAAHGATLWSEPGPMVAHDTGAGRDILAGAVKRDDTASDVLFFKFRADPLSDFSAEEYYAAFELFEGDEDRRLAVGNSQKAWAYSAFHTSETGQSNKVAGDFDLFSSRPERAGAGVFKPYALPRHGQER